MTVPLNSTGLRLRCWLLALAEERGRRGLVVGVGVLLAAAAGVRLSAGLFLPVLGLYLVWRRDALRGAWWLFGLGGALGLAVIFLPLWLGAPEATRFWLLDYHVSREAGSRWGGWVYKAGFMSRWVQAYFVLLMLGVGAWLGRALTRARREVARARSSLLVVGLWVGLIGVTLVHLGAPFPYEDYQVFLMPLWAALVAVGWSRLAVRWVTGPGMVRVRGVVVWGVLLVSVASAFSSPMNQQWFVRERDRIWWRLKDQSDLARLREMGRFLRSEYGGDGVLLTQDTYVAVESGLRVPAGLELGPFSYYPDWSREEAEQRHVLNRAMLEELLESTDASWAAFSGYGLAIRGPEVSELAADEVAALGAIMERRYDLVRVVPHFGQAHTALELWRLRGGE